MVRKCGLDVRSNWIFYDNSLLVVESLPDAEVAKTKLSSTTPDMLRAILEENNMSIQDASEAFYQKTREQHGADTRHPWLHMIKLASYADAFVSGLEARAEIVDPAISSNSNDDYPRELIREAHHPYLDAIDEQSYAWRVPGRMESWNLARDGLWLQIKPRGQFDEDIARD